MCSVSCLDMKRKKWGKEHKSLVADTIARQWKLLANGQMPKAAFDNSVLPLLTTCWDQAPYYNEFCPPSTATAITS